MAQAVHSITTSEKRKLAVLMRMALMYAAGAEPDAARRAELLDLRMACWRQAQLLRRYPGTASRA